MFQRPPPELSGSESSELEQRPLARLGQPPPQDRKIRRTRLWDTADAGRERADPTSGMLYDEHADRTDDGLRRGAEPICTVLCKLRRPEQDNISAQARNEWLAGAQPAGHLQRRCRADRCYASCGGAETGVALGWSGSACSPVGGGCGVGDAGSAPPWSSRNGG